MAYKIADTCISCGACEPECPVSCISQGDSIFVIDADRLHRLWCLCKCLSSRITRTRIVGKDPRGSFFIGLVVNFKL